MSRGLLVNLNPLLGSGSADRGGAFCAVSYYSPVNRSLFLVAEPVTATPIPTTFKPQDPRLQSVYPCLLLSTFLYPILLFAASQVPRFVNVYQCHGAPRYGPPPQRFPVLAIQVGSDREETPLGSGEGEGAVRCYRQATPPGSGEGEGRSGAIDRRPRWGPEG